jgi:hypothetical protein
VFSSSRTAASRSERGGGLDVGEEDEHAGLDVERAPEPVGSRDGDRIGAVGRDQVGELHPVLQRHQQALARRDQQLDADRQAVERRQVGVRAHQGLEADAVALDEAREGLPRRQRVPAKARGRLGGGLHETPRRLLQRYVQDVARSDQVVRQAVRLEQTLDRDAVALGDRPDGVAGAHHDHGVPLGPGPTQPCQGEQHDEATRPRACPHEG